MDKYDESSFKEAEKDVEEIRNAALKKVRITHPEIEYVIDSRSIDDYCEKVRDYPGKWYYMGFRLPQSFKTKEELIDDIAGRTIAYFTKNGGADHRSENSAEAGATRKKSINTAIVYYSKHHGNTKKIIDSITAHDPYVTAIDVTKRDKVNLSSYDRIGFASGIYFNTFAKQIISFAKNNLPENKEVFYIYTHGAPFGCSLKSIRSAVKEKNCREIGIFHCRGYDTFGPFKAVGGIAKKHPNDKDAKAAVKFYKEL